MKQSNKDKLNALHNLLNKELKLLSQQHHNSEYGSVFQDQYLKIIDQSQLQAQKIRSDSFYENRIGKIGEYHKNNFVSSVKNESIHINYANLMDDPKDPIRNEQIYCSELKQDNTINHKCEQGFIQLQNQQLYSDSTQQSYLLSDNYLQNQGKYQQIIGNVIIDDNINSFCSVDLKKEINGLQSKIQQLEHRINMSDSTLHIKNKHLNSSLLHNPPEQRRQECEGQDNKKREGEYDLLYKKMEAEDDILNKKRESPKHKVFTKCKSKQSDINYHTSQKAIKEKIQSQINEGSRSIINNKQKYQLQNNKLAKEDPSPLKYPKNKQIRSNSLLKYNKQQPNIIRMSDNSPQSHSISQKISKSQEKSKLFKVSSFTSNKSNGCLELKIGGTEGNLENSKRQHKPSLTKLSFKNTPSSATKATNKKSSREISSSHSQQSKLPSSTTDSGCFAQQYKNMLDLKHKLSDLSKEFNTENVLLNEEQEKQKDLYQEKNEIELKSKKVKNTIDNNEHFDQDYQNILISLKKSELKRKQQKIIIQQLRDEMETVKNVKSIKTSHKKTVNNSGVAKQTPEKQKIKHYLHLNNSISKIKKL